MLKIDDNGSFKRGEIVLDGIANRRLGYIAVNAAAKVELQMTQEYVESGKAFKASKNSPALRSVRWQPNKLGAMIYTKLHYAGYLENGTRPHQIHARKSGRKLSFHAGGSLIIRAKVNHPGYPAMPYFFAEIEARKAAMIEAASASIGSVVADAARAA
jgi:hypothetical protein